MRITTWIFAFLLGVSEAAESQQLAHYPKVEVAATAGVVSASPGKNDTLYGDDWYGEGRYAGSIAYYWTRHLKTEFEHQWSGEGERYFQAFTPINGVPYSYGVQSFHQLQQSSLRMVWQFRDNAWVHPYVSAGAVLDIERQHYYTPPIYQTSGRDPLLVRNSINSGHRTELRGGWTVGGGAKFYMTENAFFNTGLIGTFSRPSKTVSAIAGFGLDF
jgi:opacity protein-like surface antigen